ncbi:class I SAM-dependent methyltransferase [Bacillaceae bacterium Marseille-Q3522]|nr:class I SAM-dependent methyltransferase [Bacillaceae bacterium Marseille-Q3522]
MNTTPVEELFFIFNNTAVLLQEELSCTYLDALAATGENIFHQAILQEELSELTKKRLRKTYENTRLNKYTKEQIRQAFQLAILKGMQENIQPNHQMTPDSIGMIIGFLLNKFVTETSFRLLDPAVGTGNLLTTVMNQQINKQISAIGVEIDDLLIKLAYVHANLQEKSVELFNQDSLEPLFVEKVDAVVCDLPVGYYPNDVRAKDYELCAKDGHSYAHHLFIEQSVRHVKPGGYLFLIIPNGLFESKQAPALQAYIQKYVHLQGILRLSLSLFKNKQAAKSILILQTKAAGVTPPKQVLLAQLPGLSKKREVETIFRKIDQWVKENK